MALIWLSFIVSHIVPKLILGVSTGRLSWYFMQYILKNGFMSAPLTRGFPVCLLFIFCIWCLWNYFLFTCCLSRGLSISNLGGTPFFGDWLGNLPKSFLHVAIFISSPFKKFSGKKLLSIVDIVNCFLKYIVLKTIIIST